MPDAWRTLALLLGDAPGSFRHLVLEVAHLSHFAAAVLAVVGLILALLGSRPPVVRVVAFGAGGGLGLLIGPALAPWIHVAEPTLRLPLMLGMAALGAAVPESVLFTALGGAGGVLAASLFPEERRVAFFPGFLLVGAAGAVFFPWLAATLTGVAGGQAFAMGLAACLPTALGGPWLLHHPEVLAALGLAVGLLGTGGQLAMPAEGPGQPPSPQKAREREIRRSDAARDLRFKEYSRRGRKR